MKPDWLKADLKSGAGPDTRPRPPTEVMKTLTYNLECNLVLPAPEVRILYLDGTVYEILAPGTHVTHEDSEFLIWRGLYQARELNHGLSN
jgi:hypothetical protein